MSSKLFLISNENYKEAYSHLSPKRTTNSFEMFNPYSNNECNSPYMKLQYWMVVKNPNITNFVQLDFYWFQISCIKHTKNDNGFSDKNIFLFTSAKKCQFCKIQTRGKPIKNNTACKYHPDNSNKINSPWFNVDHNICPRRTQNGFWSRWINFNESSCRHIFSWKAIYHERFINFLLENSWEFNIRGRKRSIKTTEFMRAEWMIHYLRLRLCNILRWYVQNLKENFHFFCIFIIS